MKYITTRNNNVKYTFEEALLMGYAPDGGLIMPEGIPAIPDLDSWSCLNFLEIADRVMEMYISKSELPDEDRRDIIEEAFSSFDSEDVVPVVPLHSGVNIAELFHGLTRSCKDVSMCVVGRLMQYFLKKSKKNSIVLVGTAGDTGSASISAVAGLENVDIIVLYPSGRVSYQQELQLTTNSAKNVHVYAVEGTSDDLDVPIKECFLNAEFAAEFNLCCLNSVNWARVLLQTVPYIYCYFRACRAVGERVYFYVPTGAAGSLAAGVMAWEMGIPISIVPCVNKNNIMCRTLTSGIYEIADYVHHTYASAMDIQVPYNIERILFMGSIYNTRFVKAIMKDVDMEKTVEIPAPVLMRLKCVLVDSCSIKDDEILQTMRSCWNRNKYPLCPHSATAMSYYYKKMNNDMLKPVVCMATASPSKFPDVMKRAGLPRVTDKKLDDLSRLKQHQKLMRKKDDWLQVLKNKIYELHQKQTQRS